MSSISSGGAGSLDSNAKRRPQHHQPERHARQRARIAEFQSGFATPS